MYLNTACSPFTIQAPSTQQCPCDANFRRHLGRATQELLAIASDSAFGTQHYQVKVASSSDRKVGAEHCRTEGIEGLRGMDVV